MGGGMHIYYTICSIVGLKIINLQIRFEDCKKSDII